jgi:hypothetical protein
MKNIEEMMGQQNQLESILQKDVPKGREGKHKRIITKLLGGHRPIAQRECLED